MNPPVATRLVMLPRAPGRPATCLHLDREGRILARQSLDPGHPPPPPGARTLGVVPGEAVRALWLDLPAHSPVQALAAARILLQDHLATDGAGLHLAIGEATTEDPRLVAVTDDARMQEWLQQCEALGMPADALVPDHLLLPAGDEVALQVAVLDGLWVVRGRQLAFSAEPGLARQIIGERAYRQVDDRAAVEVMFASAAAQPRPGQLDLLQYAHARRRHPAPPPRARRMGLLAAFCLLSPLLLLGSQTLRHALGARWLEQQADTLAAVRLPHARGDASEALHALHGELAAPATLAVQVAALSNAIGQLPGARLDSLEYTSGAGLRAGLVHPGEPALQALRQHLAADGIDLLPLDSEPAEDGLRTRLALEPAP